MTTLDRRELERLRHTPGEALLSRDFRDQAAMEAQRRWWHVRGAHGAYGVALGLQIRLLPPAAPTLITVLPGAAYDAFGRELLIASRRTLSLPADLPAEGLALVLRRGPANGAREEDLSGACPDLPPPLEEGELAWLPAPGLAPSSGVVLARLVAEKEQPVLDPGFRPIFSRAFARPRIGSGSTVAGGTAWETWFPTIVAHRLSLGVQVRVDTRAAGFTQLPCYFAWVEGNDPDNPKTPVLSLPAAEFITQASTTGFLFRTRLADGSPDSFHPALDRTQVVRARRQLSVCWLGIQERYVSLYSRIEVTDGNP